MEIGHAKETYHNIKREEHVVHVIPTKVAKPIAKINAQPIKLARVPLRYPCIICSCFKHYAPDCLKKTIVQKMFRTKSTTTTIVVAKPSTPNNIPVNVVTPITTQSQVLEQ
jgi:hypothetical protein